MNINATLNQTLKGILYNGGTKTALPIITVKFTDAATEYKIIEDSTGKYIRVYKAFAEDDVLIIDCNKQSVEHNGVNAMAYIDAASRFFEVPIVDSTYTITPAALQTTVIEYEGRWI